MTRKRSPELTRATSGEGGALERTKLDGSGAVATCNNAEPLACEGVKANAFRQPVPHRPSTASNRRTKAVSLLADELPEMRATSSKSPSKPTGSVGAQARASAAFEQANEGFWLVATVAFDEHGRQGLMPMRLAVCAGAEMRTADP